MTDPPGGWLHEAHLVETHKVSIPIDSVADAQAAAEVCHMWARNWLDAHGLEADVGTWTNAGSGRTGAVWSITVGRAASTVPGAGQPSDWTWSARAKEWARSLHRAFSPVRSVTTQGRIGRHTDPETGADVVSIHGANGLREDRRSGMGIGDPHREPGEIPVEPGTYDLGGIGVNPTPYTLEGAPLSATLLRPGPPTGYFSITGPGLPPGGVEGQADPRTGPTAEDIHEALKRADVMANPLASEDVADQRPPWLRRLDGWDEDEYAQQNASGVPPGLETYQDAVRRKVEREVRAENAAIERNLEALTSAEFTGDAKRTADDAVARLRRQAAMLGLDPNAVHSRTSIELNRPRCGACYQPLDKGTGHAPGCPHLED